jgi:MraZ protein
MEGRGDVAMPFVGTHDHTLDDKGRLVMPAEFRTHFDGPAYLSPWAGCVALWTADRFKSMVRRLEEEERSGETDPAVLRGLAARSKEVRLDPQGRIIVPPRLREFAALERDVVVCGAIDRIEIWNAPDWGGMADELDRSIDAAFRRGSGI